MVMREIISVRGVYIEEEHRARGSIAASRAKRQRQNRPMTLGTVGVST
jgi:hypothetical protein